MTIRMQEMLEDIWRLDGIYVHYLDKKVLKRLIKQGKAKISNTGIGRKRVAIAIATSPKPTKEEPETLGPYAKRRAACEEAGLSYKGKTWGKLRVDLPREEREKKISDKKKMWNKLKGWQTHNG